MNCPVCVTCMFTCLDESTVSRKVYRCARCKTSYRHLTGSGEIVQIAMVTAAFGAIAAVLASLFTGDW